MEVTEGKRSLKTNSGIERKCIKNRLFQVDVKIESESDDEAESEMKLLYADHVIKEEMVIGPEVLHKPICNSYCSKDVFSLKTAKLEKYDKETNQEHPQTVTTKKIVAEEDITASDTDALPHKKPRLQKQQKTTDLQENSDNDTEEGCTTNVDWKIDPSTDIHTKQKEKIKILTNKSKSSIIGKTHRKTQVTDENINQVNSYNIFTCNDCGEHFKRKRQLMQHIGSHEKIKHKIYLNCKECTYQTVIRDSLKRHKTVHDKSRRYVCDVCGYRFKYEVKLKAHFQSVHSGKRTNKCAICDFRTNLISNLNKHLQIHSGEKPYLCSVCEFRCARKSNLTDHMKIHTGEKPFSCSVCKYICTHKSDLTRHMKIHTGEKPFSCTVCEYRCVVKSQLTRHMKIHTQEKPFSCPTCEYRCNEKNNLKKHMTNHTGEKPFSCTVCEYRCAEKSQLTRHMKTHTQEKPFSCPTCEYRCNDKSSLKKHNRKIHTGGKPFSCTVCEYRCTEKSNLTCHMKIHTGDYPFSCTVCEYRCSRKIHLTDHMKIHTGEKPFSCTVCKYRCTQKSHLTRHIKRTHNK